MVLYDQYELQARRARSVKTSGSPVFLHIFGALAATAQEHIEIARTFPAAKKYEPLMELVINNGSTEALDVFLNGNRVSRIPPGVIKTFTDTAVWSLQLVNNDSGTAASGTVSAEMYTPSRTADAVARGE